MTAFHDVLRDNFRAVNAFNAVRLNPWDYYFAIPSSERNAEYLKWSQQNPDGVAKTMAVVFVDGFLDGWTDAVRRRIVNRPDMPAYRSLSSRRSLWTLHGSRSHRRQFVINSYRPKTEIVILLEVHHDDNATMRGVRWSLKQLWRNFRVKSRQCYQREVEFE